jgi:ceramide glucosyltransferase
VHFLLINSAWWIACATTAASGAYLVLAIAAVATYQSQEGARWPDPPKVTLLKPLYGFEDGLAEAIESFLLQEVSASVRFVFGVADAADPALVLARQIAARNPTKDVAFVVDARVHGPNPKVSNLVNMARLGIEEIVIISDSDVVIAPGVLQRAIDALAVPRVGAVTSLYRSRPGRVGVRASQFGAWFLDYWFLPMAVLHARLAPLATTYGPLTAIRGEVLKDIGGILALADHLSDDAELGRLVREAGWAVTFTPDVVETLVNDSDHTELFDHELRWARTVRGLNPLGFVASVVSHPGPLPLMLLLQPGIVPMVGIGTLTLLRWLLSYLVEERFGRSHHLRRPSIFAIWARDCYCFAVWCAAFAVRRVDWRGQQLSVHRGDILRALPMQQEQSS